MPSRRDTLKTAEDLKQTMRRVITEFVNENAPTIPTAVLAHVAGCIASGREGKFDVPANNMLDGFADLLEQLILEGEIVELEYVRPDASHKISSLLFRKGTEFCAWRNGDKP